MKQVTLEEATNIAKQLNLDLNKIPVDHFRKAMQVELEHGIVDPSTDVTGDDLLMTGKIGLAHIKEFPDYYKRLEVLEEEADVFWESKDRPDIFLPQSQPQQIPSTQLVPPVGEETSVHDQVTQECYENEYRRWSIWLAFVLVIIAYGYIRG